MGAEIVVGIVDAEQTLAGLEQGFGATNCRRDRNGAGLRR
jgi:hypothetical protein